MEQRFASQNLLRLWCKSGLTFKTHAPRPAAKADDVDAVAAEAAAEAEGSSPSPHSEHSTASSPTGEPGSSVQYSLSSDANLDRILGIVRGSKGSKTVAGSASAPASDCGGSGRESAASPTEGSERGRGRGRGRGCGRGRGQAGTPLANQIDKDGLLLAQQRLGPLKQLGRAGVKGKWKHKPSGVRVVVKPGEFGLDAQTICRMGRSQEYDNPDNRARIVMEGALQFRRREEAAR